MRLSLWAGCFLLLCAATAGSANDNDQRLQKRLRAHIEFLADDLMLGRQAGSKGYDIAANYVASQYRQMGLAPAGHDDSFFQQVPMRQAVLDTGSAEMAFVLGDTAITLDFADQFYMRPSLGRTTSELEADLVFTGYGIEAPELGYSDYRGIDVAGKVVVFLAGQPHDFPSEEGAHFASNKEKTRAAVRHGAVGILTIYTPRAARRYPWDRLKSGIGKPSMGWIDATGEVHGLFKQIQAGGLLRDTAAAVLFENAPVDLSTLIDRDEKGEALPAFDLDGRVRMYQRSIHAHIASPNVAAVLPGSDPLLADEYVTYTAHLDHIGELQADDSDSQQQDLINNGALDNASGISVMLETARLLSAGDPPRRSVLFIAVTAEEKGLVGSEYFAMNPTVPIDSIVASINLDMPVLLYEFADVIAFGAEHSSLGDTVREAAQSFDIQLSPDPFPEENLFTRSDHYRFVQQGVPSVFLVTGMTSPHEDIQALVIFEQFLQQHYHRPSDNVSLPIHYPAAAKFTRINARIGELIANETEPPTWREGDFFGRTYAK